MRRLPGQGDLDWSRIVPALLDAWIPGLSWTVEPKTRTEAEAMAAFFVDRVEQHFSETATFLNR